jgi:plastocyanin
MRIGLLTISVFGLTLATAGTASLDLHGTARAGNRPQAQAVVWLDSPNVLPAGEGRRAVLDQRNLGFSPRVLVVRVGALVDFPNNDRVFHNVFSFRDGKKFDLGLYPVGTTRQLTFEKPGVSRIFCNIHPNMAAYVVAVDSPYFSATDEKGAFSIAQVPAGTFTYHAWRAGGPELTGTITVGAGLPFEIRWP